MQINEVDGVLPKLLEESMTKTSNGPSGPIPYGPIVQRNFWILAGQSKGISFDRHQENWPGQLVCGFDVEKIGQDKVATLFKIREVDNPLGKQFAHYISFTLTNGQTYVIDTTNPLEREWDKANKEKEGGVLEPASQALEDKDSMEAKTQQEEIDEAKVQTLVEESAVKMLGIDVRLDKMQETSQEIAVQSKDPKA
uniref:Uncharacterized protein n=1 Tax=Romanomermis culicivorax TaxID=13658 RepID=A0A915L1A8_ROMCU